MADKNADTHKMRPEDTKKYGAEDAKKPHGGVLHQRRSLPYSPATMAVVGFLIAGTIGYLTLYAKKKPEASAGDVAKAALGASDVKDNPALRTDAKDNRASRD